MRKVNQTARVSDIYALIQAAHMLESDRKVAVDALRRAESIVDAFTWVQEKVAAVGTWFLKPSMKH